MRRIPIFAALLLLLLAPASALERYGEYAPRAGESEAYVWSMPVDLALVPGGEATVSFSVPEDVFVYPAFEYIMTDDGVLPSAYALYLDGELPYAECASLTLDGWWGGAEEFAIDRYGNEVAPMPVKLRETRLQTLKGKDALYDGGMGLFLSKGDHTLTLRCAEGAFSVTRIGFVACKESPGDASAALAGDQAITIEAERAARRNSANIRASSLYNTALTPYSTDGKRMNYIEDGSWKYAGDTLEFDFEVAREGWYGLSLRCRQTDKTDYAVFRTAMIDGAIPSSAFDAFAVPSTDGFVNYVVRDADGNAAAVYLTAGKHTLSLAVTVAPLREEITALRRIADEMAAFALEVSKITGGNTDTYRDFDLSAYGLDAAGSLARWRGEIADCYERLCAFSAADAPGQLSPLKVAMGLIDVLAEKPDDLPKNLSLFAQGASSARFYVIDVADQMRLSPLGLDSVTLFQDESLLPLGMGFFESAISGVRRFFSSFGAQSYDAAASTGDDVLRVWLNRPRQLLEILQQMIDSEFTPQTGIKVELSIMPDANKLILANASGSAPDAAVGIASGSVFELAVRGVLADMRQFDTFKEVGARFTPGLLIPGAYADGCYALPETFNFTVLFYRKDILQTLELDVPDSMQEVRALLPVLHRYGMNFNHYAANTGSYKGFSVTLPAVVQSGGTMYLSGSAKTTLGEEPALEGIRALTNDFTVYGMEYEVASFFQSFRDGTLPLGTSNMSTYLLLLNAAPEIAGQWAIAPYPGETDENGETRRWTCNSGESSVIFSSGDHQQEAWWFLDWYMSDAAQAEFGHRLQATMGNEYLWNSANLNAFLASSWPTEDKRVIAEQLEWTYEPSRMMGAYMVERELSNAINAIALDGEKVRTAMDEAIRRIDREVARKMAAYGLSEDDFTVIDVDTVRGWLQ